MPSPAPATPTNSFVPPAPGAPMAALLAAAILIVFPSVYSFHFISFAHAKLAALATGTALLCLFVAPEQIWDRGRVRVFAPLFALLIWAGIGAAITGPNFVQSAGLTVGASYAVVLLAALVVLGAVPALTIQRAVAMSCIPVALLALAQYARLLPGIFPVFPEYDQRMYSVFGNQDLLGGYLAIGLALGFALWLAGSLRSWVWAVLFASAFPALLLSGSRSAWLAAAVGGAMAVWNGRAARRKLTGAGVAAGALLLLTILAAPGATWQRVAGTFAADDVGYRIRLWIWDGTMHLIAQHPIVGVGLGNYAYRSPLALGEVLYTRGPGVHLFNHVHTQHAHSDWLEIAAETGVVGIVLLLVFVGLLPRKASPAWTGLTAALVFSLINTTLHSPPHLLVALLLAGSLVPLGRAADVRASGAAERLLHGAVLAVAVLALAYVAVEPSWRHARAQALYDAGQTEAAVRAYREAAFLPGNHAAAYEYTVLLTNNGRNKEAMEAAQYAAQGYDTGDLHYLRAYLAERNLPMRAAADSFRECLKRWPDHRLAHEGLVRNSGPAEREALLAEAKRWLSPEDYAAVTEQPSAPR